MGILIIFLGALYWFYYHFTPYLHYQIEQQITQATDSILICKIDKLESKLIETSFTIHDFSLKKNEQKWKKLTPSKKASIHQINIQIPKLQITRWYWWQYFLNNTISLDDIIIRSPTLELTESLYAKKQNFEWQKRLQKNIKIKKINILNCNFTRIFPNEQQYFITQKINNAHLDFKNISYQSIEKKLNIQSYKGKIEVVNFPTNDLKNNILVRNITFNNQNIEWQKLVFQPFKKIQNNTTKEPAFQFFIHAYQGKIENINWNVLFEKQTLTADKIICPRMSLMAQKPSILSNNLGKHEIENITLTIIKPFLKPQKIPQFENFVLECKNYQHKTPDGLFVVQAKKGLIDWKAQKISLEETSILPVLEADIFAKNKPFQSLWVKSNWQILEAEGIDWQKIIQKQEIEIEKVICKKPNFIVELDKTKPKNPYKNIQNFESTLQSLPIFLRTKLLKIEEGNIKYTEKMPQEKGIQTHKIENLNVHLQNFYIGKAFSGNFLTDLDEKKLLANAKNYTFELPQQNIKILAKKLNLNATQQNISLENCTLQQGEQLEKSNFVEKINIEKLDFQRLWRKNELYAHKLTIYEPKIKIHLKNLSPADNNRQFYEILSNLPFYAAIQNLEVQKGFFEIENANAQHIIQNANINIPQVTLGKAAKWNQDSTHKYLYDLKGDVKLWVQQYELKPKTSFYSLIINDLRTEYQNNLFQTSQIILNPIFDKNTFFKQKNAPKIYSKLSIPSVKTYNFDVEKIFKQELFFDSLSIEKPNLYFFFDKTQTIEKQAINQNFSEIIANLPFKVHVQNFKVQEGNLTYEEQKNIENIGKHSISPFQITSKDLRIGQYADKKDTLSLIRTENLNLTLENYQFILPDSSYQVGFKRLQSHLTDSIIKVEKLFIEPLKENIYKTTWKGNIENVQIFMNDFRKWLFEKEYIIYHIHIQKPQFEGTQNDKNEEENLKLPLLSRPLHIDTLSCEQGKIQFLSYKKSKYEPLIVPTQLENINAKILKIDWKKDSKIINAWQNIELEAHNYKTFLDNNLLESSIEKIHIDSKNKNIELTNTYIKPRFDEHFYSWATEGRRVSPDIKVEKVKIQNFNFEKMKNEQAFEANFIHITQPTFDLFKDKRWGKPTYKRLMLNDLFQLITSPFQVDSILIQKGHLKYSEQVVKGKEEPGEIFVSDIYTKIKNLNNLDTNQRVCIEAEGLVMGEGHLTMFLEIFINRKILDCKIYGELNSMSVIHFNPLLEPNYHVRLRKGIIQGGYYQVEMKDKHATGILLAGYKRLRIQFLKPQNHKRKQSIKNFFANLIIKKRNNMYRKHPRKGEIDFKRTHQSFWAFFFQAVGTGLIDTLR